MLEMSQTPSERQVATAARPAQMQGRNVAEAVLLYLATLHFSHYIHVCGKSVES